MSKNEFLLDTDILNDHLYHSGPGNSYLELLMTKGLCFTTVINAAELIFHNPQKSFVIDVLNAVKVLGIHPKYSVNTDKYKNTLMNIDEALFCAAAEMNKLQIVTLNKEKYSKTGLQINYPQEVV